MTSTNGVFLDLATVDRGDMDLSTLESACERWTFHDRTAPDDVAERIADADLVVTNKVVIDRDLIETSNKLRWICIAATGTNNVDLDAARQRGIAVANVTGYATPSVVQHVLAAILCHGTRLFEHNKAVRAGDWSRHDQFCLLNHSFGELDGQVLGIVGYGELGRGVARGAGRLGLKVLVAQRPNGPDQPGRIPLNELLPQVDILSLHCPLTDDTRNLIGARELAAMKPSALLINTARGGIVNEPALADALRRGVIGGAAVDVLTEEPPRADHPLLAPDIPDLIVTPHIAWASVQSRQRMLNEVAENIRAFDRGEPRNRVA